MDYQLEGPSGSQDWRGLSLTELYGSASPWGAPELPLVSPAYNHSVLYHISNNGIQIGDRPPRAQIGQDMWDHDYVRMPCSDQSLYPVEHEGTSTLRKRWEIIKEALEKPIGDSEQLANAILSYNTKFISVWKFQALHALFNDHLEEEETQYFFNVTLPEIVKLALALPKLIQAPIPLLKQHKNRSISLSQQQIASLLANAFFCTFPRRNTTKRTSEYASYPHINFNVLYESAPSNSVLEKLKYLCHYFRRVTTKVPMGVMTFMRRSVPPRNCPDWERSSALIGGIPLHVNSAGKIEDDGAGLIQVDFANKYLGGGVLGRGCVQEEIRFVICPELMISMLFTEVLRPNEALIMIGCERYSKYTGYGSSFRWAGNVVDDTPFDSSLRRRSIVLAIDALPFHNKSNQYNMQFIVREINKAWVGFSAYTSDDDTGIRRPGIATGNWGCGAFGGSPYLKFLLQLIAASEARRPMAYYTFGDVDLRNSLIGMYNLLAKYNVTVGELYGYIKQFASSKVPRSQLYEYLHQYIIDREKTPPRHCGSELDKPMDISDTNNESETVTKKPRDDSPDLFSPESDEIQTGIQKHSSQELDKNLTIETVTSNSSKSKRVEPKLKPSTVQTRRLFEEMSKFDEESGKVNFDIDFSTSHLSNTTHYDFRFKSKDMEAQNDVASTSNGINEVKVTIETDDESQNDKEILPAKGFDSAKVDKHLSQNDEQDFNENDKFHAQNDIPTQNSEIDRDVACFQTDKITSKLTPNPVKDELLNSSVINSDVKKQLPKKITDYFNKKV